MKKREYRRYLTKKYQQKQIRYRRTLWGQEFDDQRRMQSDRAKRNFFVEFLKGNVIMLENKYRNYWMWGIPMSGMSLTPETIGRYKKHSFDDCGRPLCPGCCNPRRVWKGRPRLVKTLNERMSDEQFYSDLLEYVENSGIDYVCKINGHNPRK
jgi:hypothetical protein